MAVKKSTFDPSKRLDIYFRIARDASKSFTFVNADGSARAFIYDEFQLIIKKYPGAAKNVLLLDLGAGISYASNVLIATVTTAQSTIDEGEYYWELYNDATNKTWLSGYAYFHNGVFDGVENESETITVTEEGEDILITIQEQGITQSQLDAALALKADLASPALTGSPTAPTQLSSDNSTKLVNSTWVRNLVGALPAESLFVDDKIQTSEGNTYSLTGMTSTQRGTQLQLAIDEATNNSGVIIFIPGGIYYSATGFVWDKRETALIGFARSQVTELTSDLADTLTLDSASILYNTVMSGFSVGNTGGTKDAIKLTNLSGAAVLQSQLELYLHVTASSRDGFHAVTAINACNFDFKMTTKSVDLTRYSVYVNSNFGGSNIVLRTDDAEVYLDSSSQNVCVEYLNNTYMSSSARLRYTNLGTDNNIFTPSNIKTISSVFSNFFSKLPIKGIPKQYVTFYYPLNDVSRALDFSENQNDAIINGSPVLYNSGIGNIIDFDGVDDYVTIPTSSLIQGISDTFIIGIVFSLDSLAANKRIYYAGTSFELKFETTNNQIVAGVNIGGSVRTRSISSVSANTMYCATIIYDGASFILRLNQQPSTTLSVTGNVSFGSNNIDVGRIATTFLDGKAGHFVLLNTYSKELLEQVEAHLANMILISNTLQRSLVNKLYEDLNYQVDDKGLVLMDRTTATKYRLYVDSGALSIEAI